jgi:hypothetical protein
VAFGATGRTRADHAGRRCAAPCQSRTTESNGAVATFTRRRPEYDWN